jgi:hypothetical protein
VLIRAIDRWVHQLPRNQAFLSRHPELKDFAKEVSEVSFPISFPPGVSQNVSATPEGRQSFSPYGILTPPRKPFLR